LDGIFDRIFRAEILEHPEIEIVLRSVVDLKILNDLFRALLNIPLRRRGIKAEDMVCVIF